MADVAQTDKKAVRARNKELVLAALQEQEGSYIEGHPSEILLDLGLVDAMSVTQLRNALDSLVYGERLLSVQKESEGGPHGGHTGFCTYRLLRRG